jgi:tetratricopeptide (TPR) repeat protein
MSQKPDDLAASVAIDPENPWLGLSSYTEETRAYFHGRDEEAAELARRVQRKNLTVLFGQSGLGKTSLLRAGLVPRLRGEGFCPVYVRVDYNPESPSPSEQIKQAIFRATADAGHWSRPGTAIEGESLWEFLHHRGDLLRDASGRTLLPLLIFDQFEEIFTLAQADDAGRLRAREFLADLADLVENRPPAALEARLDVDEAAAEDFDFARADYRILIALREDYLAHLESVKGTMPSITQNRMRLARMTGTQALAAVMQPGGRLVSQEVAESIVRFVAGGTELANAEVEPSLLSLICRELNNVRLAQKRQEISADLLAGSRDTILSEFYGRALADQPEGVRRVIEDELLTESGYRESLAEERVVKALAAAGAAPDALAKLVNRRLLRIEERLDMRRVELTHDVLCSVVAASRDLSHEREARDEAERRLAVQHEREAATRRALVRARTIAAVCAVLMVVAAASAVFGWVNYRRARVADAAAQESRMLAEKARGDAEKLVGFLIEDFYAELAPTGRLDTMGKLAHQAIEYYDGLPPQLMTPQTRVYRGMALIREGGAQLGGKDIKAGTASIAQARALFEQLRAGGDKSEPATYGLALSLMAPFYAWGPGGGPGSKPNDLQQAADLLRPFAYAPGASRQVQITYADTLNYLSHSKDDKEEGIAVCEEARKILVGLGALDLSDLNATSAYADTTDSQARHTMALGRFDEAAQLESEVYDLAEKALVKRPGDLRSMNNRFFAADLLGRLASARHDYAAAERYARRAAQAGEDATRFNPTDLTTWGFWIQGRGSIASALLEQGKVQQAIETLRGTVAFAEDPRRPSSLVPQLEDTWATMAVLEAQMGQLAAADRALDASVKASGEFAKMMPAGDPRRAVGEARLLIRRGRVKLLEGDAASAYELSSQAVRQLEQVSIPANSGASQFRNVALASALGVVSDAALRLGRYSDAEAAGRRRVALPPSALADDPLDDMSRRRVLLALAIAKQGRGAEAMTVLAPALEYYRRERVANASGTLFRRDFAEALYVSALAQGNDAAGRSAREQALAQAAEVLSGASPEARQTVEARELAGWITAAR